MEAIHSVQSAIDYMEEQLYEHLELEQIAAIAFMSVPSMYRVFYALTGHPLKEYIRKRRTSQAAALLRQSELSVLEIALDCGFDSYQTFTKSFKKLTGLTPGVYRIASLFYSFERINLLEKVSYCEKKELTEQYPDVKVLRMGEMQIISYRHYSAKREGLEKEAFLVFHEKLEKVGFPFDQSRFFGRNIETHESNDLHEYEMLASFMGALPMNYPDLRIENFSGGLYAVSVTPANSESTIITAWNRLLAEWLPRSTFTLGDHTFIEEFDHYKGKLTKLKLYLPVKRKKEQESIEIVGLQSTNIIAFRAYGENSQSMVDDQLTSWLQGNGLRNEGEQHLFMSYSYGIPIGEDYWYELGISIPDPFSVALPESLVWKTIDGGLYASLTTIAYGAMTGVLDLLYNWLFQNGDYIHDEIRHWFARYTPDTGKDLERTTRVTCYIPVILKTRH
jgi:AraC-like DNA-binding protein/DNA gyrase inhibitor GyrI